MIKTLILTGLEQTINRLLLLDASWQKKCKGLTGHVIALELTDIGHVIYLGLTSQRINLQSQCYGTIDLTIRGTIPSFIKMSMNSHAHNLPDDMEISGKIHLAKQLQQFFASIDLDWEEQLSHLTGDTVASGIGRFFRRSRLVTKRMIGTIALNTTEFLQQEKQLLPTSAMVATFCADVDKLRHDIARLASKIEALPQKFLPNQGI